MFIHFIKAVTRLFCRLVFLTRDSQNIFYALSIRGRSHITTSTWSIKNIFLCMQIHASQIKNSCILQRWERAQTYRLLGTKKKKRKSKGIGLFPVSKRSMHFNSNPLQVDLSQSHGPEREEKVEIEKARGGRGVLMGNGAWSTPSCSTEQLLWQSLLLPYCCAKHGPYSWEEGWRMNLKQVNFYLSTY